VQVIRRSDGCRPAAVIGSVQQGLLTWNDRPQTVRSWGLGGKAWGASRTAATMPASKAPVDLLFKSTCSSTGLGSNTELWLWIVV
jgi:hypothetical protein